MGSVLQTVIADAEWDAAPSSGLTVLRAVSDKPATKVFRRDRKGNVIKQAFGREMHFSAEAVPLADIRALAEVLRRLEGDKRAFVVRGELVEGANPARTRRLMNKDTTTGEEAAFRSKARSWVMIDIDGMACPAGVDPVTDPEGAVEYVIGKLPLEFQDATCWWQWSSSQGMKGDTLLVHLWFWLDRPIPDAELKRWGNMVNHASSCKMIDTSLFNAVQPNYTAAPIFQDVHDPMPLRSGLRQGLEDAVALLLPEKVERSHSEGAGSAFTGIGVQGHLAAIGGPRGFHEPIKAAIGAYYALNGASAPPESIMALVREAIVNADPGSRSEAEIERYSSDRFLDGLIQWVADRQAETDAAREAVVEPSWPMPTRHISEIAAAVETEVAAFFQSVADTMVVAAAPLAIDDDFNDLNNTEAPAPPPQVGIIADCAAGKSRAVILASRIFSDEPAP